MFDHKNISNLLTVPVFQSCLVIPKAKYMKLVVAQNHKIEAVMCLFLCKSTFSMKTTLRWSEWHWSWPQYNVVVENPPHPNSPWTIIRRIPCNSIRVGFGAFWGPVDTLSSFSCSSACVCCFCSVAACIALLGDQLHRGVVGATGGVCLICKGMGWCVTVCSHRTARIQAFPAEYYTVVTWSVSCISSTGGFVAGLCVLQAEMHTK